MARATVAVIGVTLGFAFVYRFHPVLLALFVSIILATGLIPIVDRLEQRGVARIIGATLVFTLLGLLLGVLLWVGLPFLDARYREFAGRIPAYYQTLRTQLSHLSSSVLRQVAGELPDHVALELPGSSLVEWADTAGSVGHAVIMGIGVLLFCFYWLVLGPRALRLLLLLAPRSRRDELRQFTTTAEQRLGAFVRGQVLICATVGALALCSYAIIGLPNLLVLGLLAGLFEAVPMVGPLLGAVPAVLVALTISPSRALWVIGAAVIIHVVESFVLVPRVMRKAVGVHPALCLLAVATMGSLLGLRGALLAIPTAALVQLAVDRLLLERARARVARAQRHPLCDEIALIAEGRSSLVATPAARVVLDQIAALASDLDRFLVAQAASASRPHPRQETTTRQEKVSP